jgi:two-component system, NtrC family, nitrogen regulation sensor histidine kinase NtrY
VSLRARFLVYLVILHLLLAALAAWLITTNRLWLFAAELVFVVSFSVGLMLLRSFTHSLDFVRDSAQLLEDSDFMSRVREVGQSDIDRLIRVYNRMVGSLRDERVRLEEQHQFLARVLRESPGGILVLDFDRRVEMTNPAAARLLQTRGADIVGLPLAEIDRPLAAQLDALTAGESHVVSIWGGRRVRAAHGTFVDRGFRRSFYLLEELTEELRQSEKAAYEKLIRLLSHEVNNTVGASNSLLNSCLSYSGQLAADDRADFERAIGVVIGRTAQLNDFMRSFADVVRLRSPIRREVDLAELVQAVAALAKAQADPRGIAVSVEIEPGLAPVFVDRAQIEQALLNVAKNGIEAIGRDGTLTFRAFARDGSRVLEIEDTGPGISPSARDQLFTPFFSTKEGGQGIGLTLVQEILVNHDLDYALEGPAGGPTRFVIVFAA